MAANRPRGLAKPVQRLTFNPAKIRHTLLPWAVPALIVLLWVLASRYGWMSAQTLPAPSLVWQTAVELGQQDLWANLWISLQRLAWGLTAGVAIGAVLGASLGFRPRAERVGWGVEGGGGGGGGGVVIGGVLGASLGFSPRAERMVFPPFSALAQIPT